MGVDPSVYSQMAGLAAYARPRVTTDAVGKVAMEWPTPDGIIKVTLDRITRKSDSLNALVRVFHRLVDAERPDHWRPLIATRRINLFSDSAMRSFASSLKYRFSSVKWPELLDHVVICGEEFEVNSDAFLNLRELEPQEPTQYLLERFVERGQHTLVHGQGGTAKSLLALAMAISVATGETIVPGIAPFSIKANALYLDWETTSEDHRSRMQKLCGAIDIPEPDLFYRKMEGPLADYIDVIREKVLKDSIDLVVIDSVGLAAGGDVSETAVGLEYMRTVRAIPCAILSITHNPKDNASVIGSVYFRNAPRYVFSLEKEQETNLDEISIALLHTKSNNSKLFPARGFRVRYENEVDEYGNEYATAISYVREDVQASPTLSQKTTQRERIVGLLRAEGLQSYQQIAEHLNKSTDQIRPVMARELKKPSPAWQKFDDKWGLLDRNNQEGVTRNSTVRERTHGESLKGTLPPGVTPPDNSKEEEGVTRHIPEIFPSKEIVQALDLNTGSVTNVS
jgi:hypothetical protein